ncbi:MAG: EAL domain-containing protein [Lachnospiraceae bacterium]
MGIDNLIYSKAFDRFLLAMKELDETFPDELQRILDEVCSLLHIAQIEVVFYENVHMEQLQHGETVVLYQKNDVDRVRVFSQRETTSKGNVIFYNAYQQSGDDDWDSQVLEKIQVLLSMIFLFNGRTRLVKIAEKATFYDKDLELPNLVYFKKYASGVMEKGEWNQYIVSFFNLNRFSMVNHQLGRALATTVMKKYILQLQDLLGDVGIVCRVGGDNFITAFRQEQLDMVTEYLQGMPIVHNELSNERVVIRANAGYFIVKENDLSVDIAIDRAHMACYSAKNSVSKSYVFYDDNLKKKREHSNFVERNFQDALENEEFLVYYQPKVLLRNYRLAGAEALCRWKHDGKIIPPDEFISVLEQDNSICKLDFYVLEKVCKDIRRWMDTKRNVVRVSVNMSRRHMGDPELLHKIIAIIDKYQVPHEYIEIELTETLSDVGFCDLKNIVCGLKQEGIYTSVDDFGVGYSSLNLIRQVPWDVVKIDKSFVPEQMKKSSVKYIMLRHLLSMIQDMGLRCIVEGVETVEQVRLLKENNCYYAQGYYFDRPLVVDEFEKRLDALDEKPMAI